MNPTDPFPASLEHPAGRSKGPRLHDDQTGKPDNNSDAERIENLQLKLAEAEEVIARLERELSIITQSVIWRATRPLRSILNLLPPKLRRRLFRFIQLFYRLFRYRLPNATRFLMFGRSASTSNVDQIAQHYGRWVRDFDTLSAVDRTQIRAHIQRFGTKPLISIIMPTYETSRHALRETIESVLRQLYPNWELCIADDASKGAHVREIVAGFAREDSRIKCTFRQTNGHIAEASNTALELAAGEYVALLDQGDVLSEHALYLVAEAIQKNPAADVFYSDKDKLDAKGRRSDPHFKPDWSSELFFGQNYLNHLTVYKRSVLEKAGGFRAEYEGSQDYDLALRIMALTGGPVVHIPHVLYHRRIFHRATKMSSKNMETAVRSAGRALREYFAGLGSNVTIKEVLGAYHRVVRPDPAKWPKVSVIVPTRDHLDVLKIVVDGLRTKTDYPELEIVIADNDSSEPATLDFLRSVQAQGIRVIECRGEFNYSDINNKAIGASSGDLLLLLNNDISMLDDGWLKEMVRYLSDPAIAVVGPKLLYPDGTLQHAGVVIGLGGVAGHRYVGRQGNETGRFGRLALAQDVSCVTGACLLIRRSVYLEVGGLDAENLPVAFNDVDLCLRVQRAGYRIIWTPFAVLIHHESKSRGSDLHGLKLARFQREIGYMQSTWKNRLQADPFHNPNLSLQTSDPALAFPPRVDKPWKRGAAEFV
jgi:GT2 family glycosyltransferase